MKVIKLTASALADTEQTRARGLARNIDYSLQLDKIVLGENDHIVPFIRAHALLQNAALWDRSHSEPVPVPSLSADDYKVLFKKSYFEKSYQGTPFLYQDCFYDVIGELREDQKRLLVLETADKERQLFERLKAKFESPESRTIKPKRERIPEAVRIAVWRRDEGRCARCGSRDRLEYDHMVPVDRGGGSTVRNVELLCETCNRSKSNNIE